MRISDWSSDVCSSDLRGPRLCRLRSHAVRLRVVHAAGRRGRTLRAPARAACRSAGGLSARFLVANARPRGPGAVQQHAVVALQPVAAGAVEGIRQTVLLAHGGMWEDGRVGTDLLSMLRSRWSRSTKKKK